MGPILATLGHFHLLGKQTIIRPPRGEMIGFFVLCYWILFQIKGCKRAGIVGENERNELQLVSEKLYAVLRSNLQPQNECRSVRNRPKAIYLYPLKSEKKRT